MTFIWPESKLAYLVAPTVEQKSMVFFENVERGKSTCNHPLVYSCQEDNPSVALDCREDVGAKKVTGPFIGTFETLDICECETEGFVYSMIEDKCSEKITDYGTIEEPEESVDNSAEVELKTPEIQNMETSNWVKVFNSMKFVLWPVGIVTTILSLNPTYFQSV